MDKPSSFFDTFQPKVAFLMGVAVSVLGIGTVGFLVLGGMLVTGNLGGGSAPLAAAPSAPSGNQAAPAAAAPSAAAGENLPVVTEAEYVRGNVDAPITLIEYSDFECPFCSRFHPTAQQLLREYPDKVRMVYRHFPLSFHPEAEPAAEAAECAGEQGKFWEFHDKLFENQSQLGDAYYTQLAGELGLDASAFADCRSSDRTLSKIRTQAQEGGAAGVTGTPGSFLVDQDGNVVPIQGAQPYSVLKSAVDQLLAS